LRWRVAALGPGIALGREAGRSGSLLRFGAVLILTTVEPFAILLLAFLIRGARAARVAGLFRSRARLVERPVIAVWFGGRGIRPVDGRTITRRRRGLVVGRTGAKQDRSLLRCGRDGNQEDPTAKQHSSQQAARRHWSSSMIVQKTGICQSPPAKRLSL
jgi:hypothetical protein